MLIDESNLKSKDIFIRYTDVVSLCDFYSTGMTEDEYPRLYETFVMSYELGRKVLFRRIPQQEYDEKKHLPSFWLVNPDSYLV